MMRRREFITLLGGAAAWPVAARAQQPAKVSRIGFVAGGGRPPSLESSLYAGFAQGMRELGYIEGKHFIIDYRFARGTIRALSRNRRRVCAPQGRYYPCRSFLCGACHAGSQSEHADRHGLLD